MGPGVCSFNGRIYLVWKAATYNALIVGWYNGTNVLQNTVSISENTYYTPSCTAYNGQLWIGWTGTDSRLNLRESPDGTTWNNNYKWTLSATARGGGVGISPTPFDSNLWLSWDSQETSPSSPQTAYFTYTNILNCTTFTYLITRSQDIAATSFGSLLYWTIADSNQNINIANIGACNPGLPAHAAWYSDTANAGIGITGYAGELWMAWGGTDSAGTLNIAHA